MQVGQEAEAGGLQATECLQRHVGPAGNKKRRRQCIEYKVEANSQVQQQCPKVKRCGDCLIKKGRK